MSKVLIPVGDAIEAVDTLYPFFRVQEDGFEAVVAGQDARVYAMVMHEIPPGWDVTREGPSYHIEATVAFRDVTPPNTTAYSSPADAPPSTCATTKTYSTSCVISSRSKNPLP